MNNHHHRDTEADKYCINRGFELAANNLYNRVADKGLLSSLKRVFGGTKKPSLFTLDEVKRQIRIQGHESLGEMAVDLDMVLGTASDGRAQDFDIDFRPLQAHNKERWLGVAAAWMCGRRLGRVKLLQVGDIFFVEDGHHRISVAKAMGEQCIDADVVRLLGSGTLSAPVASEQSVKRVKGTPMPVPA